MVSELIEDHYLTPGKWVVSITFLEGCIFGR